jgi:hypothetical protein
MYMKSVCFFTFILHISGTDRYKINVRYIIFWPVIEKNILINLLKNHLIKNKKYAKS